MNTIQWRIQDLHADKDSANTLGGDANLFSGQIFPENCMKM